VSTQRPPAWAVGLAVVAALFFVLPLAGLVWRAPWATVWSDLTSGSAREALKLSLVTSTAALVLAVVFGVPLAWVQARTRYPGQHVVRALTTLPMVLPPVVGGIALQAALGRRGLVGQHLGDAGIVLPFHLWAPILASTFVSMPFFVLTVEGALRTVDTRLEDAAHTLGAGRWGAFRHVTLPLIRPSLVSGAVLAWARALGEFGATITFAGNLEGHTQTLPLYVYLQLQRSNPDASITLSLVLLAISLVVILALRDRWLGGLASARRGAGSDDPGRPAPVAVDARPTEATIA
jgi:molybdate transport system permease protein